MMQQTANTPEIASVKVALSSGLPARRRSFDEAVTVTLERIWTLLMMPPGQKWPMDTPFFSVNKRESVPLHSCPGKDCRRVPLGDCSPTVPWDGTWRSQLKRCRGMGRQVSRPGIARTTSGHNALALHTGTQQGEKGVSEMSTEAQSDKDQTILYEGRLSRGRFSIRVQR